MLTPKENYLKVLNGETPEWIPTYTLGANKDNVMECPSILFEPSPINGHRVNNGGPDIWGVNYVGCEEAGGAILPEPNNFILDDITKWRDVIKAPDLTGVDWEACAKKEFDNTGIDRKYTAVAYNTHLGYFQLLMSFMGFSNGLMALFEEPEECKALLEYLSDFYCSVIEKTIDIYKPDVYTMMDDTAAWANPFISMSMYKEFFYPLYEKQAKFANDRGIPITFHNCGKCQAFMEEAHNFGVISWDPAQSCNDLDGFKAKYGNSYVICGGWDGRDKLLGDDVTDEQIYESVRATINRLAPNGGFLWCGGFLGAIGDEKIIHKNSVVKKAVDEIGKTFYKHN
ncbi:MAG: veratrol--corrinoid protein metyltransferase [Oscillospiraceae bacterium]|nr:veratrol--corrinoid protein metyltransferase [Oscillospiraceae bacterium]